VDFIGPNRTSGGAALAVRSGVVLAIVDLTAYGTTVIVDHGEQVATVYGHLAKVLVEVGQEVEEGNGLGLVGSTGLSTGAHLHFELWVDGETVNPLPYLALP
jgi:murein DD-endopeptidase MepM/ murein hydrolase activator NlpD